MRIKTDDKGNQRDRIAILLRESANAKGYVRDMDVPGICRITGIDAHDVAKHLWGLQKQGLIGFSTKHVHGKTVPYRFRLTQRFMQDGAPEPTGRPERAIESEPGIEGPDATETPEEAAPVQEVAAVIPVPQEVLDDSVSFMDARRAPFTAEHYPEIHSLLDRVDKRERVEEAARALEAAGLDDMALAALDAIPSLTPLEHEILAVVRGFRTPEWDEPGPSVRETIGQIIEERT